MAAELSLSQQEAGLLDPHPDRVQGEEHGGLAAHAGALAVPERPVPVADERHGRRDQRGDRVRGEGGLVVGDHQVEDTLGDQEPDAADDAELGELVDQVLEPLVQPADKTHLAAFLPRIPSGPPR